MRARLSGFFRKVSSIGLAVRLVLIAGSAVSLSGNQAKKPLIESPDAADLDPHLRARWQAAFARPETVPYPLENPYSLEKAQLGEALFFDPRLSRLQRMSCARCHNPELGLEDGIPVAEGENGLLVMRHTQTVWNLAWTELLFWDGRIRTLEDQVKHPITEPREMNFHFAGIIERLSQDTESVAAFQEAFPDRAEITAQSIEEALATYQRGLISPETRFDDWISGDETALADEEKAGFSLFVGKAGCVACHSGWRFTDDQFRDVGLDGQDEGRFPVTGETSDLFAFRTPGLREVSKRAPYMHDGSLKSLEAVIRHHTGGFIRRESLDPALKEVDLSEMEIQQIIAFLGTLSATQEAIDAALVAE